MRRMPEVEPGEEVRLDARPHGIALVQPLLRPLALVGGGVVLIVVGQEFWIAGIAGAALIILAALLAFRAVLRWDRTRLLLTTQKLTVVYGVARRRSASVALATRRPSSSSRASSAACSATGRWSPGDFEVPYVPGRAAHSPARQLEPGLDPLREPLRDHDRRNVREARGDVGHDRGVRDRQPLEAVNRPSASRPRPPRGRGPIAHVPTVCGIETPRCGSARANSRALPGGSAGPVRGGAAATVAPRPRGHAGSPLPSRSTSAGSSRLGSVIGAGGGIVERSRTVPRERGRGSTTATPSSAVLARSGRQPEHEVGGFGTRPVRPLWKVAIVCRSGAPRPAPW